jgi:hypothetical protein
MVVRTNVVRANVAKINVLRTFLLTILVLPNKLKRNSPSAIYGSTTFG